MRRPIATTVVLASLFTLAATDSATAQTSLEGAWIATGWASDGKAISTPQRGLLIFTKANYSIMFVTGAEARPGYTGTLTDPEKLAAYDSFVANSGRYTVVGNSITTAVYMAKDPNFMAQWGPGCATGACPNDTVLQFKIEGSTLTVTWPQGFGASQSLVGTFRRVE